MHAPTWPAAAADGGGDEAGEAEAARLTRLRQLPMNSRDADAFGHFL